MNFQWKNGLLIKRDRICIPLELYQRMLHNLHEGHKGVEKMQHLTCDKIYWQGMDMDIVEYVRYAPNTRQHKQFNQYYPETFQKTPGKTSQQDFFTITTQNTSSLLTPSVSIHSSTKYLQR